MAENLNEEFLNLYGDMLNILRDINSVNQHCVDFNEKWRLNVAENLKGIVKGSKREFEYQKSKITRKEFKCIFIGETSAGKSTLINAILGRSDLPRSAGQVTNSFVEIKETSNNYNYFTINNETLQREIGTLKNFITFTSQTRIPSGSHIDLFYTAQDCPLVQQHKVFIDIPGIDADEAIDERTLSYCRGADLIVLVVNSTITLSNRMKRFINDFKTIFSNLNIILVYNHSDQLDDEDDPEINIAQLRQHANIFFKKEIGGSPDYARGRTFFLSAKEEMTNRNTGYKSYNPQQRRNEFARFKELLTKEMRVNSIERRIRYLKELYKIIKKIIIESRDAINKINNKISIFSNKVLDELKKIPNLEKDISNKISNTMTPLYDEFYECALREMRRERNDETRMMRIKNAVTSILNRGLSDIKKFITDKIRQRNNGDCLRVIERMYFPEYLETNFPSSETVREGQTSDFNLRTGLTTGLTAGGVALGVAAAIAAGPVAIPLAIGTLLIGILSGRSINSIVNDKMRNQDEHEIRIIWNELVNSTRQSFSKFLREIKPKLPGSFAGAVQLSQLSESENRMDNLRQQFDYIDLFY